MPPHMKDHPIKPHDRMLGGPPYATAFIATLVPVAQAVKKKWGVPIAVLIAQGAQESGWGQHVKGNAYFGIKGKAPGGKSVNFATHEVTDGKSVAITDAFRAYASLEEAADDYGQVLKNNPRWATCFAYSDQPDKFIDHLASYATDPDYAQKLKKIVRDHELADYDKPGTRRSNPWRGEGPQHRRNPWAPE